MLYSSKCERDQIVRAYVADMFRVLSVNTGHNGGDCTAKIFSHLIGMYFSVIRPTLDDTRTV
eukprot:scaffold553304_cov39-Prasinocladus_malaysianus.AAC.1